VAKEVVFGLLKQTCCREMTIMYSYYLQLTELRWIRNYVASTLIQKVLEDELWV